MFRLILKSSFYIVLGVGAYALFQRYFPTAEAYYIKSVVSSAPVAKKPVQTPQQACYATCAAKKLPRWVCEEQYSCNTLK